VDLIVQKVGMKSAADAHPASVFLQLMLGACKSTGLLFVL
jgi:hypothetical protein